MHRGGLRHDLHVITDNRQPHRAPQRSTNRYDSSTIAAFISQLT